MVFVLVKGYLSIRILYAKSVFHKTTGKKSERVVSDALSYLQYKISLSQYPRKYREGTQVIMVIDNNEA